MFISLPLFCKTRVMLPVHVRSRMRIVRSNRNGSCDVYVQNGVGLNGNGPGSCFLKARYYLTIQKGTSRTKIRPSHVKIMVFRPLIWAVDGLYRRRTASDVF